ncbi:hypothetical protein ES703_43226 [subsurface metagenome]
MWNKALEGGLYWAEAAIRTPYVDFDWDMSKYQEAFDKLDAFTADRKFTDEELGELVGMLGEQQPRGVRAACFAVEGLCKSRLINFEWDVEKYQPVFDQIKVMREDDKFTDEEFADFLEIVRKTLEEE